MRRFLIQLAFLTSVCGLSACGSAPADWTYAPLDNFDPAQVSMLPANPYWGTGGTAALIAPRPRVAATGR